MSARATNYYPELPPFIPGNQKEACRVAYKGLSDITDLLEAYLPATPTERPQKPWGYEREVHHYWHSPAGWSVWSRIPVISWNSPTIINHNYGSSSRKKEKDNTLFYVGAVLFGAAALGMAYTIGQDFRARQDRLEAGDIVRKHAVENLGSELPPGTQTRYESILAKADAFFVKRQSEAVGRLAAKVALFAGLVFATIGCIATSSALVGVGVVMAFVASCGWLFEKGYYESTEKAIQREAEKIALDAYKLSEEVKGS